MQDFTSILDYSRQLQDFYTDLSDWYWNHGIQRKEKFHLPRDEWTKRLYDRLKESEDITASLEQEKPSTAIWGPSQTGKSTLFSNFLDQNALKPKNFQGVEGQDGRGSALHWYGGRPFFFFDPRGRADIDSSLKQDYLESYVLNPFNNGQDGSSCLTRFVAGSLDPASSLHHVKHPKFPVTIELVRPKDLLHSLARGYETECIDTATPPSQVRWTSARFANKVEEYKIEFENKEKSCSREVYEKLHDFCEVLDDLTKSNIDRYKELRDQGDDEWDNLKNSLLANPILSSDDETLDRFIAEIFWDGAANISEEYTRVNSEYNRLETIFKGKAIYCSLQVASQLLNMATPKFYYEPESTTSEYSLNAIREIGYKIDGDDFLIGTGPEFTDRLTDTAHRYAAFQSLVWELIVPINADNLYESSFKDFILQSDLLDFPGVGNEQANENTKIRVHQNTEDETGVPYKPVLFYYQILKRGKTASIVSTYAKRLTIDCFNLFLALDQNPPVNANQLVNGIETWWKNWDPTFQQKEKATSPLPLNLGLCWWGPKLKEVTATAKGVYQNLENRHTPLGKVGDPIVCTTFALNYHSIKRGRFDEDEDWTPGSDRHTNFTSDPAFAKQFGSEVSKGSFDAMLTDKDTGGASYFFEQLSQQELGGEIKETLLHEKVLKFWSSVNEEFFLDYSIWPEEKGGSDQERIDTLETFRGKVEKCLESADENLVRDLNYSLRELLNIEASCLSDLPEDPDEISDSFIDEQFNRWINRQLDRYKSGDGLSLWNPLGVESSKELRGILDAFVKSAKEYYHQVEIVEWTKDLASKPSSATVESRQFLAVKLTKLLVSGPKEYGMESDTTPEAFQEQYFDAQQVKVGKNTIAYTRFLKPLLEEQLRDFIELDADSEERPTQPGDEPLFELYFKHFPDQ